MWPAITYFPISWAGVRVGGLVGGGTHLCLCLLAVVRRRRRLEDIKVPTMVIAGEIDAPTPPARMEVYRDRIPGAKWAVIPGAAHLPNFEKPEAFNEALAGFLGAF